MLNITLLIVLVVSNIAIIGSLLRSNERRDELERDIEFSHIEIQRLQEEIKYFKNSTKDIVRSVWTLYEDVSEEFLKFKIQKLESGGVKDLPLSQLSFESLMIMRASIFSRECSKELFDFKSKDILDIEDIILSRIEKETSFGCMQIYKSQNIQSRKDESI